MITITIHGNIVINLGGTDNGLLSQLQQLKENAMSLLTQEQLNAYAQQVREAGEAANQAATAESTQVAQVIADLQALVDGGASNATELESAIETLSGVRTNIENIYQAPEPMPEQPVEPGPTDPEGTGTEVAEPITDPLPVTDDENTES